MKRREFLQTTSGAVVAASLGSPRQSSAAESSPSCCDRTYASPAAAMKAPHETVAYVP